MEKDLFEKRKSLFYAHFYAFHEKYNIADKSMTKRYLRFSKQLPAYKPNKILRIKSFFSPFSFTTGPLVMKDTVLLPLFAIVTFQLSLFYPHGILTPIIKKEKK